MKKILVIIGVWITIPIGGITIGSHDVVSRQGQIIFPSEDTDNEIRGFTFMEKGFILEDGKTTCSINNQFEFAGDMFFNGGTLFLVNDFIIKQGARAFSPPTIYGNNRKVVLPFVQNTAILPAGFYPNFVAGFRTNNVISSLDWNFTSQWIAFALSTGVSDEVQLAFFDGNTAINQFSLSVNEDINPLTLLILDNTTINVIRWNPAADILAIGANPGANDELLIYEFDNTATTLTQADTAAIGDSVTALSWHSTGTWLAIGTANTTNEVRIFSFDSGDNTITSLATDGLSPDRTIQRDAMSWNNTGEYLAVGTSSSGSADELLVYYFDESTITVTASVNTNATVSAVDWHPTLPLLAVGLSEGLQRTRIYNFNSSTVTLSELTTARTNEFFTVTSLEWHKDGVFLLINKVPNFGFETQIYLYNPLAQTLTLYNQVKQIDTINDARWAPSGLFFSQGGNANSLSIHSGDIAAAKLIDTTLLIRSKLTFLGAVLLKGITNIDSSNNQVDISNADKILLGSNSTILFQNMILKGVSDQTLSIEDDMVKVIFNNTTILLDGNFTLSMGSIEFRNAVTIGGNGVFIYQTAHTSTINAQTKLTLDEGITFSYDPIGLAAKDLIEFTDNTSELVLNGGTLHATVTGMQLKKGMLRVTDNSIIESETAIITDTTTGEITIIDEGITIGSGDESEDIMLIIYNDTTLQVAQGSLHYRNVALDSFLMDSINSRLQMLSGTELKLFESINIGDGHFTFEDSTRLGTAVGKTITGSIFPFGKLLRFNFVE